MKFLRNFLSLIRWRNLLIIAGTQILFQYGVVNASAFAPMAPLSVNPPLFWLICLASVCIAAGGNIINDYFDVNIDLINKPEKVIIDKSISRRAAIMLHAGLSALGVMLSGWLSWRIGHPLVFGANLVVVLLLWIYSTNYKASLLLGNVLIALLSGWVILVLLAANLPAFWQLQNPPAEMRFEATRLLRIGMLYTAFAFAITLVREVIKDIEDRDGDQRNHCRTLPIVYGVDAARVFGGNWLVLLIVMVTITLVYVIQFQWWLFSVYLFLAVLWPLIFIFRKLFMAKSALDFGKLSHQLKWVMVTGVASMLFFVWYK